MFKGLVAGGKPHWVRVLVLLLVLAPSIQENLHIPGLLRSFPRQTDLKAEMLLIGQSGAPSLRLYPDLAYRSDWASSGVDLYGGYASGPSSSSE